MPDLSVLIAARCEMFLKRTIDDVLSHAQADTEVITVLDGAWADPPLPEHPKVRVIYRPQSIGQRAAVNLAARLSDARYVMKLDAHCSVEDGFDAKLIAADEELGRPDVTQIPAMYNLHAFNWKCEGCGNETYQGPTPTLCTPCAAKGTPGGPFVRVMIWDRRRRQFRWSTNEGAGRHVRTEFWRFDHELHFQYFDAFGKRPEAQGDLVDVMSSVGASFFMRRARFLALGGLDEAHGSWGQFGTEIACKSWLSGGRHIVNKRTWFAHLFRTQGGDFSFPYQNPGSAVARARAHSRKLWIEGTWPGAQYPLSWLIRKFAPLPDWTEERLAGLSEGIRRARPEVRPLASGGDRAHAGDLSGVESHPAETARSKGIAYYTDCRGDEGILTAVRAQIQRSVNGHRIVAATLQPLAFGHQNVVLPLERGHLTMFRQILAALEALDTDIAFLCEHDVLYHPTHFAFTPPERDRFYFNRNTWRVDAQTGRALFYLCSQVSGLCAYRDTLIDHYRKRVAHVEQHGFSRNLGFEPGTNARARALDGRQAETWMSTQPNIDIKTKYCLTPGRWDRSQFRNQNSCLGWTESDSVPGWGKTFGRFREFLADVKGAT